MPIDCAQTRGRGVRLCALSALGVLLALACSPTAEEPKGIRNLLLVCFDTVRYDSFRLATVVEPASPVAKWSNRAVRLDNVLAPAPWTVPSVASVLTGLDPIRHGAGVFASAVANLDREIPSPVSPDVPTLAGKLAAEGFDTAAFVAHPWFVSKYGLERGFGSVTLEKERRRLAGKASTWLSWRTADREARPFFLYLHFTDSHRNLSWLPRERHRRVSFSFIGLRDAARAKAPGGMCDDPEAESCLHYIAYVRSIGEQLESLAQILDILEESGQAEETVVILYSDHGEEFNDHAGVERALGGDPRDLYGLGHGQSLYQEQLHVPVWIWHPGLESRDVRGPVSLLDLMPTALEWLGVDVPSELDGRSLAPWLEGRGPAPETQRLLFATRIAYGPEQASVVRLPWKRISRGPDHSQLFHLGNDPGEQSPADRPDAAAELDAALAVWLARDRPDIADPPTLSREQIEQPQSLGYLEGVPSEDSD